jgi:hypothetical protein
MREFLKTAEARALLTVMSGLGAVFFWNEGNKFLGAFWGVLFFLNIGRTIKMRRRERDNS